MWDSWKQCIKDHIQPTSDSLAVTIVIIAVLGFIIIMQGLWAENVKSELQTTRKAYANLLQNCP